MSSGPKCRRDWMLRPVLLSSMGQNSKMGWMHQTAAAKISELRVLVQVVGWAGMGWVILTS